MKVEIKKLKELNTCFNYIISCLILAFMNLVVSAVGATIISLWYLMLLVPMLFFVGMTAFWGYQRSEIIKEIEEEEQREKEEEKKALDKLEKEVAKTESEMETLKGWNAFNE